MSTPMSHGPTPPPSLKVNWHPRMMDDMNVVGKCPPIKTMAEFDPEVDTLLRRCTGGAPWTSVPIGADEEAITKDQIGAMLVGKGDPPRGGESGL